jgi:hypothetical protein
MLTASVTIRRFSASCHASTPGGTGTRGHVITGINAFTTVSALLRITASWVAHRTAASDAAEPSTPTMIPELASEESAISISLCLDFAGWTLPGGARHARIGSARTVVALWPSVRGAMVRSNAVFGPFLDRHSEALEANAVAR